MCLDAFVTVYRLLDQRFVGWSFDFRECDLVHFMSDIGGQTIFCWYGDKFEKKDVGLCYPRHLITTLDYEARAMMFCSN